MNSKQQIWLDKRAYSLKEVTEITEFSKGHLYNESRRGKLQLLKSGQRTILLDQELNRYLSELSECDSKHSKNNLQQVQKMNLQGEK